MTYHLRRPGLAKFFTVERFGGTGAGNGHREWMAVAEFLHCRHPDTPTLRRPTLRP